MTTLDMFQSTLPYGERLVHPLITLSFFGFNPRSRMGSDFRRIIPLVKYVVSIHAPVWGATRYFFPNYHDMRVSIHAPVWGATSGKPATNNT